MTELWVEDKHGVVIATYPDGVNGYREANDHAERIGGKLILATYTFDDSELLEDYSKGVNDD